MSALAIRDLFETPPAVERGRAPTHYGQPIIIWYRDKRGKLYSPMLDALDFDNHGRLIVVGHIARAGE